MSVRPSSFLVLWSLALLTGGLFRLDAADQTGVAVFLEKYCLDCHDDISSSGDLNLLPYLESKASQHSDIWEKVIKRLASRQMPPPKKKSRPTEKEYQILLRDLEGALDQHALKNPNPGRVSTFRRLTRMEYQYAIQDLLGLEVDVSDLLPKDDESHGFDNVTVGTLSPSLVDRYISAAQKISRLAVGRKTERVGGATFRVPADYTQEKHIDGLPLGTRGGALIPYNFPQDGVYEFEVTLSRDRNEHVEGLSGKHIMEIMIDREVVKAFEVSRKVAKRHSDIDNHLKVRTFVEAGPRRVGVTFRQKSYSLLDYKRQPFEAHFNLHRHPRLSPAIYQVSINGPFESKGANQTPSRAQIFITYPSDAREGLPAAKRVLSHLAKRAFRRAVTSRDLDKLMAFYGSAAEQAGFEAGIEAALQSILVSPEFLFRIEREPLNSAERVYQISDLELASRLSFFLWSSLPDEALLDRALTGQLSEPDTLEKEVRRMLADERSSRLVSNFASQWLHLRNLDSTTPDLRLFPDFDDNLRKAFRKETEMFVESVLREDRSALALLESDYTFLNERLAHHYGIPGIYGSRFRRVALDPTDHRGGLLRQGSTLTVTSYATRTSPVLRGNWILENILGTPPPPPPADVPALEENKVNSALSLRARLAEHRANPSCASCHNLMDPIGFALENYDAVGRWRQFDRGSEIDASGGLPDGSQFVGVENLEKGLLERPELFVETLTRKLMTFALGRGLEAFDGPAVRAVVREAARNDFRVSAILVGITKSIPFRMRAKSSAGQGGSHSK